MKSFSNRESEHRSTVILPTQQPIEIIQHIDDPNHTIQDQYKGIGYGLLVNVGMVGAQVGNKIAGSYLSPFLVLAVRASIQFLFASWLIMHKGLEFNIRDPRLFRLVIKRSFFSFITMAIFMTSSQVIPIGIAITLFNTGPLISFFVEAIFLKQTQIRWAHLLVTFACFIGLILIVQPQFLFDTAKETSYFEYLVYGLVLFSALTFSMNMIYAHQIGPQLPLPITLATGFLFHAVGNTLVAFFSADAINNAKHYDAQTGSYDQIFGFLIGFLCCLAAGSIGQFSEVKAMSLSRPSIIMPFFYIAVIGGMVIDVTIFGSTYNILTIIGTILTSLGLFCKFIMEKLSKK